MSVRGMKNHSPIPLTTIPLTEFRKSSQTGAIPRDSTAQVRRRWKNQIRKPRRQEKVHGFMASLSNQIFLCVLASWREIWLRLRRDMKSAKSVDHPPLHACL